MRSLLLCLAGVGSVLAAVPLSSVQKSGSVAAAPTRFIVEVADVADLPEGKRALFSPHDEVYASLRARGVAFEVVRQFDAPGLFVGASVQLSDSKDYAALAGTPGVTGINPVRTIQRPKPVQTSIPKVDPDSLWGKKPSPPPADIETTHVMTGVDKLHAEGLFGKGIKIGIIDTGTDYTHPLLGGGFGPGFKVAGGYDFVGDAYNGTNTPVPDPNPLDQCAGHGTHVAGIIGANPGVYNISGVAYESTLFSYRVFGCEGDVEDDILVEALLQGVKDGMDILTLSIGGADGWTENVAADVASRIAGTGKIVTIAAGNDGAYGSWYSSTPGNGINVISAASVDNTVIALSAATVYGVSHAPIPYFSFTPLPINGTLPIYATSNDTTVAQDACDPLPDSTPDLSGYVVIIRRGICPFTQKLANAAAKGAKQALIYDNGNGFDSIEVGNYTAALIQAADGVFLVQQYAAGKNVSLSFPANSIVNVPVATGGLVSTFTSYGPTNDQYFKPAVAAPGGNILSTWPVPLGSFAVLSGTSMATPFLAGVSALLFESKGVSAGVGRGARTLFETTASPILANYSSGAPLQTLTQQGAGLINAYAAIHSTTVISGTELILNDTAHFQPLQTIKITNTGSANKKFTVSHVPAGTAVTLTPGTIFPADGPVPLISAAAGVKFSESSFTVHPGQTQQITAHFTAPAGLDAATVPVYSGYVRLTGGDNETLNVPYLGTAASLYNVQVVDNTDVFFGVKIPALLDAAGNVQDGPTNYTFVGDDYPSLLMRLAFGTPLLLVDLVPATFNITTNLKRHASPAPPAYAASRRSETLLNYTYITRNSSATDAADNGWNQFDFNEPNYANGSAIAPGSYRALLRALKVTGNPSKESDFESWLSPIVGVL